MKVSDAMQKYHWDWHERKAGGRMRRERRFYVPCTVPGCTNTSFVQASDADRAMCRVHANRVNGKLGFAALVRKCGGYREAIHFMARGMVERASKAELQVKALLVELGAQFQHSFPHFWQGEERECAFVADFLVCTPDGEIVVQVNGEWIHQQPDVVAADKLMHEVSPYPILTITDRDLKERPDAVRCALESLVRPH